MHEFHSESVRCLTDAQEEEVIKFINRLIERNSHRPVRLLKTSPWRCLKLQCLRTRLLNLAIGTRIDYMLPIYVHLMAHVLKLMIFYLLRNFIIK